MPRGAKPPYVNLLAARRAELIRGGAALCPGRLNPHQRPAQSRSSARRLSRHGLSPGLSDRGRIFRQHVTAAMVHNSESLLAFLIMSVFMIVYLIYQTTSPGIIVFPLVFLLTFMAATRQQPLLPMSPGMRTGWLFAHIGLIFT